MTISWPGMRYTKAALLMFGLGLILGYVVVVVGGERWLQRLAAAGMATGLILLPFAVLADAGWLAMLRLLLARLTRRGRGKPRAKSRKPSGRRKAPARAPVHQARRRRN